MKNLLLFCALFLIPCKANTNKIKVKGVTVVHYNATWNEKNSYTSLSKLKDTKVVTAWIDKDNAIKESEGIRSLPTIILYMNGKEVKRWEAGLSFSLSISLNDIQKEVDVLTGADKW